MANTPPLLVEFCNRVIAIYCDNPIHYNHLHAYFKHCLGSNTSQIIATYKIITVKDNNLQLWLDDELLQNHTTPARIFMYLGRDVMHQLITACQKRLVFHAAGLVKDSCGIILTERSGRGKSTLAAWLTASGFNFLSDEIVAVDLSPLTMRGFSYPIVLKKNSQFVWEHWLGDNAEENVLQFFGGAAWIDPDKFNPGCVKTTAIPKLIIFPRYKVEEPLSICPLSKAETAMHLMKQLVNFKSVPNQGFKEVSQLAKHVVGYRLSYSNINQATQWLEEKLDRLGNHELLEVCQ